MSKAPNQKTKFKQIFSSDNWQDGKKASQASYLQRDDGTKGISFKMGSNVQYMNRPRWGKSIWIDEELNLPSWLKWFIETIKKGYLQLFGKKLQGIDEDKEFYKAKIEELNKSLVELQMRLDEAEKREKDYLDKVEFARKVQNNFNDYKAIFEEFKKLLAESKVSDTGKEEEIKKRIKENRWLLGLECFVEAKNQDVDNQTQIDLHIKTKFNQDMIFEVKSPNIKPFSKDEGSKKRLTISPALADGLSELIIYLRRTDIYSNLKSQGTYGIQKASGYIIIGLDLSQEELEMVNELNFHLYPHIRIISYNDLIANTIRELEIVEGVSKDAKAKVN